MSFSGEVKGELMGHFTKKKPARKAELAALILLDEKNVSKDFDRDTFMYSFTSLKKTFNINLEYEELLQPADLVKDPDSKRAFLRGAFLAKGTISDPEKSYHFEIGVNEPKEADLLKTVMESFDIDPKLSTRRGKPVVYLKEGVDIADMLKAMEAPVSLMKFENMRIIREVRGSVNRQVNCETANINKTITASMRQIEDIRYIHDTVGLDVLDDNLRDIAQVRMENTEITLTELGKLLTPPLGKSGVNHRLRKICEMANDLREQDIDHTGVKS